MRRRIIVVLSCLSLATVASASVAGEPGSPFRVEAGVRQLFLDDTGIAAMDGIRRTLHPPRRYEANPVLQADQPWEDYCSQYGTVLFDEDAGLLRMWYLTLPRDRGLRPLELGGGRVRAPHTTLAAYAESRDGVRWTKPKLGQFSYDGSTENNLLDLGIDNCEGMGVLFDPDDPDPARRYKCLYWDHGSGGFEIRDGQPYCVDGPDDGLCGAVSADAIHWRPLAENPLARRYCDTQQNLLFDPRLGRYVAYSRLGLGRVLARIESEDFHHWSEPVLVLACDDADGPAAQIYGAAVELYEGVYLASLWIYHEGTDGTIDTQLATSRDGIHWTRVANRGVWMSLGDADSWEGGMVRSMGRMVRRGGELYIYYGGVHGAHNRPGHPRVERKHRNAIGLARLRRDGFVSLDAGNSEGTILTQPFQLPPGGLHLNVDATNGQVQVEVCKLDGTPLGDFAASQPITGDRLDIPVRWKVGTLADHVGQDARLRITLRDAKLYSYWFAGGE